ncbi:Putative Transcriptional regulatory protein moc3 [Penicillium brasilianum]|uniref:Putative Transcriptional regulatory protein moc3 n=1 Tax=Penicillium brasilianum TaxID=104259 RepID=A0A0F7TQS1_PENBI|nr:Putative Transcriptional regulatory protein moc3 [Penicillium brasilianum]
MSASEASQLDIRPHLQSNLSAGTKAAFRRTQTGCRTCRSRRVKCDERKPVCSQCCKGNRDCRWQGPNQKRVRLPRRPNSTACILCREKKLKCIGDANNACETCTSMGVACVRSSSRTKHTSILQDAIASPAGRTSIEKLSLLHISADQSPGLKDAAPLGHLPTRGELEELIHLYFASVHHFGFVAFIHQLHFNRLLAEGKAPRELTLMMIASATRFARDPSPENLAKADAWADAALEALLPRIYQGFGAVQLMVCSRY